jgi:hypothetical protein
MSPRPPVDAAERATPATQGETSRPRPRHLLDPADVSGSHRRSQGSKESLTRVQTWVVSILVVTTILHLAAGAALAGVFADSDRMDARVGLNAMAAIIGLMAVCAGRLVHRASPWSWWLLVGLAPGVVGAWFTFS